MLERTEAGISQEVPEQSTEIGDSAKAKAMSRAGNAVRDLSKSTGEPFFDDLATQVENQAGIRHDLQRTVDSLDKAELEKFIRGTDEAVSGAYKEMLNAQKQAESGAVSADTKKLAEERYSEALLKRQLLDEILGTEAA